VPVPLRMAGTAEYVRLAREAFGAFNAMMAHLSPQERESVWNEVEGSMCSFGFIGNCRGRAISGGCHERGKMR
jgi:hypothetical protein